MNNTLSSLRLIIATFAVTSLGWLGAFFAWSGGLSGLATIKTASAAPGVVGAASPAPTPSLVAHTESAPALAPAATVVPSSGERPLIPVKGVRADQLIDTFTQARAAGARSHDAIDIVAPLGTPVVAAMPGTVERLFVSKDGGNTVYVRSADRRTIWYYAHLDGYAPGLREGQVLRQGDPIGRVGYSGNANPASPHLHFAVWMADPAAKWYADHAPINPYPLLVSR